MTLKLWRLVASCVSWLGPWSPQIRLGNYLCCITFQVMVTAVVDEDGESENDVSLRFTISA